MNTAINISVVNGKVGGFRGVNRQYIGRSNARYGLAQSALANPFHIGKDGNREMVIEKYRHWLWVQIKAGLRGESNAAFEELISIAKRAVRGEKLELACYCAPLGCHGDVILKAINWLVQENLVEGKKKMKKQEKEKKNKEKEKEVSKNNEMQDKKLSRRVKNNQNLESTMQLNSISSIFNPAHIKQAKLNREAEYEINNLQYLFKQLYYGLRHFWWKSLSKSEIWRNAYEMGQLEVYQIAPGRRNEDGSYSQAEYDWDRINDWRDGLWATYRNQFYEEFEAEFFLSEIDKANTVKSINHRISMLLSTAKVYFGDKLINQNSDVPELDQIKAALLEINKAQLEKRKSYQNQPQQLRGQVANSQPIEAVKKPVQKSQPKATQPAKSNKLEIVAIRKRKEAEAQAWLAQNPEFADNVDASLGVNAVNAVNAEKVEKAATEPIEI
ncbi:DUF4326 domain-containing protein [Laspinema sp. A4]|uniref:DUF4326 domain-containing protein n=1 Tax=Laspinema sp. D2d TaxID=2953686 RepID=UPI0021BAFA6C|nr:DUF4326 domain-containing protein [Laspinema sp. D2d]MCT7984961.1 DUF4326 domain-containing protein [Laspinema sp. D2d]